MPCTCLLPFVSLINMKAATTCPTVSLKEQNNWWLFDWLWLKLREFSREEKKDFIYSSAWKSTRFLGHNDTAAMSQTHYLYCGNSAPHLCRHEQLSSLSSAQNPKYDDPFQNKTPLLCKMPTMKVKLFGPQYAVHTVHAGKQAFWVWPCRGLCFILFLLLVNLLKSNPLCKFLQGNHWRTLFGFPCVCFQFCRRAQAGWGWAPPAAHSTHSPAQLKRAAAPALLSTLAPGKLC